MATAQNNSRSRPASAPVVVLNTGNRGDLLFGLVPTVFVLRYLPAVVGSVLFHGFLIAVFLVISSFTSASPTRTESTLTEESEDITADQAVEEKKDPLIATEIDPAALEFDTDIQYMVDRTKAEFSVPGSVNPNEAIGIIDGDVNTAPTNLPQPGGLGGVGQGGSLESLSGVGNSNFVGEVGGAPRGMPLAGTFYGRSGATREYALRNGGGTKESEVTVGRGLKWLQRQQSPDGKWMLDGAFKDKGAANDTAGTAFGLLPLLAAGKTHRPSPDNPYDKVVEKGLAFLIRKQNKKNGDLGGGMYGHGLATIALCEAYGLTQDPNLRRPAQMAVEYIVAAQHEKGGWRYSPGQAGDTSVTGWQVMALKSAQMAGLVVPEPTMKKAVRFLDYCKDENTKGYGYDSKAATPTMTAVGLLCRQYLQAWGPQNPDMIKGVNTHLKPSTPGSRKDIYFLYYATQVMHHYGGEAWKEWNDKMREFLIKTQEKDEKNANYGSWSSEGDTWGRSGGRLMITSMNLLTLEVYYRYLPLYYRESGARKDAAVQKAL